MRTYLLRRLFLFLPTLLVVSVFVFWLSEQTPGDPLVDRTEAEGIQFLAGTTYAKQQQTYREVARRYRLDRPAFYFTLTSRAFPDDLHTVLRRDQRTARRRMIERTGTGTSVMRYFNAIENALLVGHSERKLLEQLATAHRPERITALLNQLRRSDQVLSETLRQLSNNVHRLSNSPTSQRYQPKLIWHGTDNRYHAWMAGVLRGDFGRSYQSGQYVLDRIAPALHWTLLLSFSALLLSYVFGTLIGVYAARHGGQRRDRWIGIGLFALYSLPVFWVATLLLLFFTNPVYGMNWFAGPGLGDLPPEAPFWARFGERAWHLLLPVLCLTYPSLAFISRQVRAATLRALGSTYVLSARARGLPERTIVWRYAFRNALFPLITLASRILPAAVAGALIVELVFNLPGMGRLIILSIQSQDYPTLFTIVLLAAVLTVVGVFVSDVLFALADPRVRFNRRAA